MRKLLWSEQKIDAKEDKSLYFQQMEAFRKARVRMQCEKELHIHIKEMHTHIRGTGLKEEDEEKFRQCE
jgi:hypothetical protein